MSNKIAGIPGVDPTLPTVEFVLRGTKLLLSLSFASALRFEKVTGFNALGSWETNSLNVSAMIWAGLLGKFPDLTLEDVQESLSLTDSIGAIAAITALLGLQKPKDGEEVQAGASENPPPA